MEEEKKTPEAMTEEEANELGQIMNSMMNANKKLMEVFDSTVKSIEKAERTHRYGSVFCAGAGGAVVGNIILAATGSFLLTILATGTVFLVQEMAWDNLFQWIRSKQLSKDKDKK